MRNPRCTNSRPPAMEAGQYAELDLLAAAFRHAAIGIGIGNANGRTRDVNRGVRWSLGAQSAILAGTSGASALADSARATRGRWWQIAATGLTLVHLRWG